MMMQRMALTRVDKDPGRATAVSVRSAQVLFEPLILLALHGDWVCMPGHRQTSRVNEPWRLSAPTPTLTRWGWGR